MRSRRTLLAAALVTVASGAVLGVRPAFAACAAPRLAVGERAPDPLETPTAVSISLNRTLVVTGFGFRNGCEDVISVGCDGRQTVNDPQTPMFGVELLLLQGTNRWLLGTADAAERDRNYRIAWRPGWPDDVVAGAARLSAEYESYEYAGLDVRIAA